MVFVLNYFKEGEHRKYEINYYDYRKNVLHIDFHPLLNFQAFTFVSLVDKVIPAPTVF